ncbi:HypC/HybG/HupF family hydrogenase formation chaperone [Dethiosulfovibrio sp. F2B]|uniref:HypC/HybG/HupF family hydrogenase formation chaperone n=1 Tax=Dethiosulfovibrio faecalis TaxID=2720018 RepID=UPI001F31935F|nr:HypC/HybG/HupF family hydrogenase formation chaperone [Dethiosulfovibrio faecalis]MCF4150778.1 HypC/HybG/HupF family hydrogenase formation chaperone [Dethiosulfovibrio faecalis]
MCLAVPHVIIDLAQDGSAMAKAGAIVREIRTDLIDDPSVGDTVLVHAGFAIEKVSPEDSEELTAMWDKIRELAGEEIDEFR